jgi:protein-L-isoaspartate(D-aspartate) O-methyltransferase
MILTRRRALMTAAGATLAAPAIVHAQPAPWTYGAFAAAMKASGRNVKISAEEWTAMQRRRQGALNTIASVLFHHFGAADPEVVRAFREVPREYYHYNYAAQTDFASVAYEGESKPWPIGLGSALSDYRGQAYMTQLCKPTAESVALEIGTGSGYQISILSRIVKKAYSIEIIEPLGKAVARIFEPLGFNNNLETRIGDGFFGWPEEKDGFDLIMVTCVAQYVPPPLLKQLKPGGRLVIPIGQPFKREQFLYVFSKDADGKVHSKKDLGVYFIPMTGAMQKEPPPPPEAPAPKPADAPKK